MIMTFPTEICLMLREVEQAECIYICYIDSANANENFCGKSYLLPDPIFILLILIMTLLHPLF
jgi:hypothetical protein